MYAKILENDGLLRDMETQAVLRTDLAIVRKHEARVVEMMKEASREQEIASIKRDLAEIKDVLKEFVSRKSR